MGFAILGLVFIAALLISIWETNRIDHTVTKLTNLQSDFIEQTIKIEDLVERTIHLQREYIFSHNSQLLAQRQNLWSDNITTSLIKFNATVQSWKRPQTLNLLGRLEQTLGQVKETQSSIDSMYANNDTLGASRIFETQLIPANQKLKNELHDFINTYENIFIGELLLTKQRVNRLLIADWSFLIVGLLMCGILGLIITKSFTRPIHKLVGIANQLAIGNLKQKINITGSTEFEDLSVALNKMVATFQNLSEVTSKMAMGDYSKRVEIKSQEDTLSLTVNQMLDNFNQIVQQANAIAKGDYSHDIKPRSKYDILGNSLQNMTQKLRRNKIHTEQESWLKDGLAQLASTISGTNDIPKLCNTAINTISRYLNAAMGVIYIYDHDEQVLKLTASYAFIERDNLSNTFKLGEGIVGQVALEKKPILLSQIGYEERQIITGTTSQPPTSIYAFPLLHENNLLGVIELATLSEFSELQSDYLSQLTPLLATQILSAKQQTLTESLLDKAKLMTKKLKNQQEELKATNDELEQQTQVLKASEKELRLKEEQTQAINKQLGDRTKLLEQQKSEIQNKNQALSRAGEAIKQKAEEVERASAYKSEFLANMSHELRTPLNSLLILAKILSDNEDGNLNQDQIESAQIMYKSGRDLLALINDILDLAKVEAGKIELNYYQTPLNDFIESVNQDFSHVTEEKGIRLNCHMAENLPSTIVTDDHRVYQIIRNLMSNAIKFTSEGEVSFSISRPTTSEILTSHQLTPENSIALTVKDSGIGIPEEKQKLIFNSFQQADGTTSREYGGTGLGLTISAQLASLLGGIIAVESTINKGSTFSLYLPECPQQDINVKKEEKDSANIALPIPMEIIPKALADDRQDVIGNDHVLLIVEDDLQFAKVLMGICHKRGFKCLHATDGETGLSLAMQYHPSGILLDIGLPRMDGLTLLDKLKNNKNTADIPVHVISAGDKEQSAIKKGAVGYLTKPVSQKQLDMVIKNIESIQECDISDLLIIESSQSSSEELGNLLANKSVNIQYAETGCDALMLLNDKAFDCIILTLELPDISGQELLEQFFKKNPEKHPAIIIYTDRILTSNETESFKDHVDSIIIKGSSASMERLIDETQVFLHRVADTTADHPIIESIEGSTLQLNDKKVLIVDDDMRNTFALSKVLKSQGIHVVMAANGKMAIDTLEQESNIDMILMDIMMPVMDGYEAIKEIRTMDSFSQLPIIALTAKAMVGDREKCLDIGASDFIAKPIDPELLLSKIKQWLS